MNADDHNNNYYFLGDFEVAADMVLVELVSSTPIYLDHYNVVVNMSMVVVMVVVANIIAVVVAINMIAAVLNVVG